MAQVQLATAAQLAGAPSNVRTAGADNTGATDVTATIQALLDTVNHTLVPPGTYRIDGTLAVGAYRTLELLPGATLLRGGAAVTPVVRLNGSNYSQIIGTGNGACTVQTPNACATGVVHVGPAVQTVTADIQRWRVQGLTIIGPSGAAATNIGVNVTSSQAAGPTGSGLGSNYLGHACDLDIQQVGVGVKLGAICNAHCFRDNTFYLIGSSCYLLAGGASLSEAVGDNSFSGGFTHTKNSGNITVIKATGYGIFNTFFDLHAEPDAPGVPGSLYYDLGANTSQFRIIGFGNFETTVQGADAGTNNYILDENTFKAGQITIGEAPAAGLGSSWAEVRRSDLSAVYYALAQNSSGLTLINAHDDLRLRVNGAEQIQLGVSTMGFYGVTPATRRSVRRRARRSRRARSRCRSSRSV